MSDYMLRFILPKMSPTQQLQTPMKNNDSDILLCKKNPALLLQHEVLIASHVVCTRCLDTAISVSKHGGIQAGA